MLKRAVRGVHLLGLILLLTVYACSTSSWVISGELLDQTGKQFVKTGNLFNQLLSDGKVTVEEYRIWAAFARKFKLAYEPAVKAWLSAQTVDDKQHAADVIAAVRTELLQFVIVVASK